MIDVLLKNGRLFEPAQGRDEIGDIAFSGGRVSAIGRDIRPDAGTKVIDAGGKLVVPGLIDLHTHVYWGGTSISVDAEPVARRSACTTFVDTGSAGAANFHGFRHHVIEPSPLRILAYLNISYPGIFAFSTSVMIGECSDLNMLDVRECVRVARENPEYIVGVKVRVGRIVGGNVGLSSLAIAIEAASAIGCPVMAHIDFPPPGISELVGMLRPGDILTHCFRPFPNAPLDPSGGVRRAVLDARQRGVFFDIGHGSGSFSFETARGMLGADFLPDVISTDIHILSINGPAHDMLDVMSKFYCLGMDLAEIITAATTNPGRALRRNDLGTLTVGGIGDAAILDLSEGDFTYVDVLGQTLRGRHRFVSRGMVVGGQWWDPVPPPQRL